MFEAEAIESHNPSQEKALEVSGVSGSNLDVSMVSHVSMASMHSHVSHFDGRANKDDLDVYTINAIKTCATPIKLTFEDVNYKVETATKTKLCGKAANETLHILKGISGFAMPGTTTFIMGASGSGKTSLLNLLSDRIRLRKGV